MTTFEKVISVTFSVIVLILSVILMLTVGGVIPPDFGANTMEAIVEGNFFSKILFVVALVFMLLASREIIFGEKISSEGKEGLILENESGKLIISKESLENLVAGVGREIPGAESISSRTYIDSEKNVTVDVNIVVSRDIVIKEISTELQKKVKAALKQTADLDVKYVNIKIKNISNKKSKKPAVENEEKVKND